MTTDSQSKYPSNMAIIEDDETIQQIIEEYVTKDSHCEVSCFINGEDGWHTACNQKFDFIILDWKLPGLSGMTLYNRFRNHPEYASTPILIISGFLKNKDFSILDDYPLTAKIEKPFQGVFLKRVIRDLWKESLWYQEQQHEIIQLLASMVDEPEQTLGELKNLIAHSPKPVPLTLATARILRSQERINEAEAILVDARKKNPNSGMILTELGKVLLHLEKFDEANEVLLSAQQNSPDNLDRLCNLGNINLHQLDTEEANKYFDQALRVDGGSPQAQSGKKLTHNIDQYFKYGSSLKIPDSFASLLNAIGISMAHSGEFEASLEHYQSALNYVNDNISKAKLSFNLGLCYLRWSKPRDAVPWFRKANTLAPEFEKARSHLVRLEKKLGLPPSEPVQPSGEQSEQFEIDVDFKWLDQNDAEEVEPIDTGPKFAQVETKAPTNEAPYTMSFDDEDEEEDGAHGIERLMDNCPDIEEYFQLMIRMGIHLDSQVPKLNQLLSEFNTKLFNEGVRLAINQQVHAPEELRSILLKLQSKAS